MFIMHLMGGLGNQMFQWAAARSLSIKRNVGCKLDFDDPYVFAKRTFALDTFNLQYSNANFIDLLQIKPKRKLLKRIYKVINLNPQKHLYIEQHDFTFQPDFFHCPANSYISGFWQSEKYFKDIDEIIRSDFSIKVPVSGSNASILNNIQNTSSVSVHVRRGDYVSVQKTAAIHGICELDYYKKAIHHISSKLNDPKFFFFSDDIQWVKRNFRSFGYSATFIDNNDGYNAFEDLRLMSNCKHHIIANSSFSWWGAWLNPDVNKIVVAPKKWLNNREFNTTDLIPNSWVKL